MTPTEQQTLLNNLAAPFGDIVQEREGPGGNMLPYIPVYAVIDRLNLTAGEWSWEITKSEWANTTLVVTGRLTIPGLGSREGTGIQEMVSPAGKDMGADLLKGADSDALKRAALLFGVGIELSAEAAERRARERQRGNGQRQQSGYGQQPDNRQSPGQQNGNTNPPAEAGVKCARCRLLLKPAQYQLSMKKFNEPLCPEHQVGAKINAN